MTKLNRNALPYKDITAIFGAERGEHYDIATALRDIADRMVESRSGTDTGPIVLKDGQEIYFKKTIALAAALESRQEMSEIFGNNSGAIVKNTQHMSQVLNEISEQFVTEKEKPHLKHAVQTLANI